jgi:hypothetical protein
MRIAMHRRRVLGMIGSSALLGCVSAGASVTDDVPPAPASRRRLEVGGAILEVRSTGVEQLPMPMLATWVGDAATMIAAYYGGGLPVPGLEITLVAAAGSRVGFGQHQDGRWIRVRYGRRATAETFVDDWVMVHEMLHATFPGLPEGHRWMQEGLSTYLEPIVRARAGATTDAEVWRRWTASMQHGRPSAGDRGLDHTHSWGRTYWGGTLFWLMVDVRLREATAGARSIRDVVTQIAARGGNGRVEWTTAQVIDEADRATGTTVMAQTYAELALAPGDVDLDALWHRLGVHRAGDHVRLDDDAPQAELRRAITRS